MKTLQGFVAVTPDGLFLQCYSVSTHIGYRIEFETTSDIDAATFETVPSFRMRGSGAKPPPHQWVPAERRMEVILKGYGI